MQEQNNIIIDKTKNKQGVEKLIRTYSALNT